MDLYWTEYIPGEIKYLKIHKSNNSAVSDITTVRTDGPPVFDLKLYSNQLQIGKFWHRKKCIFHLKTHYFMNIYFRHM